MNNDELDKLLRSLQIPSRPEEYWREFPKKVSAKLHWRTKTSDAAQDLQSRFPHLTFFAWACGAVTLCLVMVFILRFENRPNALVTSQLGDAQLAEARKCYAELENLFPNQLQAIVFDQKGPRLLLSSQPNIPDATPLYLKICGPKGCEGFVTFSGQQIPFNGENCEVLANGSGQVLLVGSHRVWSENGAGDAANGFRLEVQML